LSQQIVVPTEAGTHGDKRISSLQVDPGLRRDDE